MFLHKSSHLQALEQFRNNRTHWQRLVSQQVPSRVHPRFTSSMHPADTCGIVTSVSLRIPSSQCHPLGNTGQGFKAFNINAWRWACLMWRCRASWVGGSPSKLFFPLRNAAALSLLIRTSFVPQLKSCQTKASALERTSRFGFWSSPRCWSSCGHVANVLQADWFPRNCLVVSQLVMAWKASRQLLFSYTDLMHWNIKLLLCCPSEHTNSRRERFGRCATSRTRTLVSQHTMFTCW